MVKVPTWRFEPEPVWISCERIEEIPQSKALMVQFQVNGEHYITFVPERFLKRSDKLMQACIIGDCDSGLLVDIPAETFTSGPRILVPESERETVLAPV